MHRLDSAVNTFIFELPFSFLIAAGEEPVVVAHSLTAAQNLGYTAETFKGIPLTALLPEPVVIAISAWLRTGGNPPAPRIATRLLHSDGSPVSGHIGLGKITFEGMTALALTLTEPTEAASQLLETKETIADNRRRDAMVMISNGISHEINNPLQMIFGLAELALLENQNPKINDSLREILRSAERVKAAVASLRSLTEPDKK